MFSSIERYVEQLREDYGVPGVAVSIVKDDSLLFAKGYGIRKLGEEQSVDKNTLFGIASISKSFTAMALGILVDEGRLNWSDPVTKYLPSFQLYEAYATREVTILDLLVHRSGLRPVSGGTIWYGSDYSRREVIDRIRYLRPISSFRSEYAYQNITYLVAGEIIQSLSGQTWDDFITQHIFSPLEMNTSNTSIKELDAANNIAHPHVLVNGREEVVAHRNYDNVGPAASINTSVYELAAYARLLLNGGQYGGRQIYSPEVAKDLWTPYTLVPLPKDFPEELNSLMPQFHNAYAFGWMVQDHFGELKYSHGGGIDGLRSLVTLIPKQNLGVIVFANNEGPAAWTMSNIILDLLSDRDPEKWYSVAREQWGKELEKRNQTASISPITDTSPSLSLDKYSGRYFSAAVGELEVSCGPKRLTLRFPHTHSFTAELDHWHYDTFCARWLDPVLPDGLITFVLDSHGKAAELRIEQPNLLDVDFKELHPIKRVGTDQLEEAS